MFCVTFGLLNKYCNQTEDTDATSDSELQSCGSEDDAQSDSSEVGDFIEHSYEVLFVPDADVECVTVQSK